MTQQDMLGRAVWLQAAEPQADGYYVLRAHVTLGKVKQATLRALGLGFFCAYINGQRVGNDLFLPLSTDYEARENYPKGEILAGHRIYVPEYDVTDMLCAGDNVLVIHFGGGWYANTDQRAAYGEAKVIWRLFGEDADGAFDQVSTVQDRIESSFVSHTGFTKDEAHDYTHPSAEAMEAAFDDSAWAHAVPAKPLQTEYLLTDCPADAVCLSAPAILLRREGERALYDAGQNTTGYPVLCLCGKRGETVEVTLSEELNADGGIHEAFVHKQHLSIVCDGTPRTVRPLFIWFGYRYAEVVGPAEVTAMETVHADVAVTSSFSSDVPLLNWLNDTFVHTQLTNMHTGIPSDCPHLERRGYTGDGQLVCHAAMNTLDAKRFYRKWIYDVLDCQDTLSGHIQYTAPYIRSGGGVGGWGGAVVEVPYRYYQHYGELDVLRSCYPAMKRYFDYVESHSQSGFAVSDAEGMWCLGDWCTPQAMILPPPFVNNYFYVKWLTRCIEIAGLIGMEADIPEWERRIEERKQAITAAYFNRNDHRFLGGRQGADAFALDIGLGDSQTYGKMVESYRKAGTLDTGIFGTDVLIRVLFEHGDGELATALLLSQGEHSFSEMQKRGATTLWEYWPGSLRDRSHNHPMFGAVTAYLYDYLLGIRQGMPGEQTVIAPVLVPQIKRLSGYRTLSCGRVAVSYERGEDNLCITVTLPAGQTAVLCLGEQTYALHEGENRLTVSYRFNMEE